MKVSEMESHSEIEACRTCGIFFLTSSNFLRYLFSNDEPEILHVRSELESWQVQMSENDPFPKYICTVCLLEFHRIFKFKNACLETQLQLRQLYNFQQENIEKIRIKTEICDNVNIKQEPSLSESMPAEQAFIYVDDLSDDEYDTENSSNVMPFKVPELPVKEEVIEEAYIPNADISQEETPDLSMLALTQAEKPLVTQIEHQQESIAGVQCHLCLHVSADQQQYRQHLLRIHETKPMECHICGKQFKPGTSETRLKYHIKWHRIYKHVKCVQCGFHCASRDVLNEHMRAVHTKTPCKICGKHLFPKKMRTHMEKHRLEESVQRFQCPYCAKDFATNNEWNEHILLLHSEINSIKINEQYTVPSFNIQEMTNKEFETQSDSDTPASSYETTITTIVNSPTNNENRILNDSNNELPENTEEISEKIYENNESYFMNDVPVEQDDETDEAEIEENDDEYSNANSTNTQELSEEMLFSCAQCPESFPRVEQLIAHSQTHCKPKPFQCNVCNKYFDLKFSLNRHLKRHTNNTL